MHIHIMRANGRPAIQTLPLRDSFEFRNSVRLRTTTQQYILLHAERTYSDSGSTAAVNSFFLLFRSLSPLPVLIYVTVNDTDSNGTAFATVIVVETYLINMQQASARTIFFLFGEPHKVYDVRRILEGRCDRPRRDKGRERKGYHHRLDCGNHTIFRSSMRLTQSDFRQKGNTSGQNG